MIHTVIDEGLVNQDFVAQRTTHYDELAQNVARFSPEAMAPVCGIPADTIREVARAFATAKAAMILWGMGVSQHVHGTDNARCLIALCAITGQIGKPGSGLHPLRGQNNVQGASDAGLIPMMFPNYQRVDNARPMPGSRTSGARRWTARRATRWSRSCTRRWRRQRSAQDARHLHHGREPGHERPDLNHARHALAALEHLVVQDIFMTETAWLADVVLPASAWPEKTGTVSNTDRMVQLGRQAITPPGDARADLWIIQQMARRLGLSWQLRGRAPRRRAGL
jgi:formate dehydrogenase major subunit